MTRWLVCYLILTIFIAGFIACGDSDYEEKDQPSTTTTIPTTPTGGGEVPVAKPIDFAAEEVAINELIVAYDKAISDQDADAVMDLWLKEGVFMVQNFFGAIKRVDGWGKIKNSWKANWPELRKNKQQTNVDKVGIDVRGRNATASGGSKYPRDTQPFVAAFKKNAEGNWKLQAWDYGDSGVIKQIRTSKK